MKRDVKICTYNAHSLRAEDRFADFEHCARRVRFEIIGISELKRPGKGQTAFQSGYTLYHCGRPDGATSRGVGFYVPTWMTPQIDAYYHSDMIIELVVKLGPSKVRLIQVHAPHSGREVEEYEGFLAHLEQILEARSQRDLVVMGDFNATTGPGQPGELCVGKHAAGQTRNARGQLLVDFCEENSLKVANTFFKKRAGRRWTWRSNFGSNHEIDYFLTRNIHGIKDVSVVNGFNGASDHRMVRCTLKLSNFRRTAKPHRGIPMIKRDILETAIASGLKDYKATGNPYNDYQAIVEVVNQATSMATYYEPLPPRVSSRTQGLLELRRTLKERRGTGIAEIEYTEHCKLTRKSLTEDLRKRHLSVIQEAIVKNRLHQGRQALIYQRCSIINIGGDDGNENLEAATIQRICIFYSTLYRAAEGPLPPPEVPINFVFEKAEMEKAMTSSKVRTVPGKDKVRSYALRSSGCLLAGPVQDLLNRIVETGMVPEDLTISNTILLYKKGDAKDIENYRPISLLSSIYKVVTKVLKERIQKQADLVHALPPEQAGFRKKFSTITQIHALNEVAEKCYEYNINLYGVFVDFKKAFDSISFGSIWSALREIGCDEPIIEVIKLLYSHGKSEVEVGKSKAEFRAQKGVRQGDSLSPLLFTLTLQHAMKSINWNTRGIDVGGETLSYLAYADDIVLLAYNIETMKSMLDDLVIATKQVGLEVNFGKTKWMSQRRSKPEEEEVLTMHGSTIEKVTQFVYLGQLIS